MENQKIIAVTVTYKNRFHYVEKLVESCLSQGVYKIIIIDNNSDLESKNKLKELNNSRHKGIMVKFLKTNKGSAYGFNFGIRTALEDPNCDFILLLDDDNRPKENAIQTLLSFWQKIKFSDKNKKIMLAALRTGAMRKDQLKFLFKNKFFDSKQLETQFDPLIGNNNGFNGLDLINNFKTVVKKFLLLQKPNTESNIGITPINPYGGSFFHKDLIKTIGLPDPKYFVYGDDWDFSYRVTKHDGLIFVLKDAEIEDMEISWWGKSDKQLYNVPEKLMGLVKMVKTDNLGKYSLYYSMRNMLVFQEENIVTNQPRFLLNLVSYITLWILLALAYRNPRNIKIFLYAITDGLTKNLSRIL